MGSYKIRVTEKHCDVVTVEANNAEEAKNKAIGIAECEYDCCYDCEVIAVEED